VCVPGSSSHNKIIIVIKATKQTPRNLCAQLERAFSFRSFSPTTTTFTYTQNEYTTAEKNHEYCIRLKMRFLCGWMGDEIAYDGKALFITMGCSRMKLERVEIYRV
jgi:hypothetical protein